MGIAWSAEDSGGVQALGRSFNILLTCLATSDEWWRIEGFALVAGPFLEMGALCTVVMSRQPSFTHTLHNKLNRRTDLD